MRRGRNVPAMIVGVLGAALFSMLAGLLLASYAVAGVAPPYPAAPAIRSDDTAGTVEPAAAHAPDARIGTMRPDGGES